MPLPLAMMIGGGILSGIGAYGQAQAGKRMARAAKGVNIDTSEIQNSLNSGFNVRNAAMSNAQAMSGFNQRSFDANNAIRGAGRNSYGIMREMAQGDARRRFGDAFNNQYRNIQGMENQRQTSLLGLLNNARGQEQSIRSSLIGQGNAQRGQAWQNIGGLGSAIMGQGVRGYMGQKGYMQGYGSGGQGFGNRSSGGLGGLSPNQAQPLTQYLQGGVYTGF